MVECGAGVFESDVMVSRDGVPFLMHDHTLLRTTDVVRVFPGRAGEDCSNFTWDQLQELDASDWFLQRNPFRTGVSLTLGQTQRVPALEELLRAADNRSISVMFDLRPPPAGHPHNESYINLTLRAILDSQIRPELVLWLPDERREDVISQAPGFRQIYGLRGRENETLRNVNLSYKNLSASEIRSYRQDNISVNLYVVDRPWLFSHLWCAGTTSVTTNACHLLQNMRRPLWVLAPTSYLVIWIVTDAVSLIHIIWAFLLQRKCCRRETDGSEAVLLMKIQSLVL
ncbi:LOW QUALITY PROTEIN: glycerophosphoinositol inositolphosphodiesterase GDPD2-like [Ascaphus truei]|uniref:LOW QUALITY PROTEIN: glycerophosphoinositol inositolphosphodiesterase GDPD2-like n=1 Tax=Ascaphus truei TaxID=8439 RepID=UPI003F5A2E9E